jgi:hypothetical protein
MLLLLLPLALAAHGRQREELIISEALDRMVEQTSNGCAGIGEANQEFPQRFDVDRALWAGKAAAIRLRVLSQRTSSDVHDGDGEEFLVGRAWRAAAAAGRELRFVENACAPSVPSSARGCGRSENADVRCDSYAAALTGFMRDSAAFADAGECPALRTATRWAREHGPTECPDRSESDAAATACLCLGGGIVPAVPYEYGLLRGRWPALELGLEGNGGDLLPAHRLTSVCPSSCVSVYVPVRSGSPPATGTESTTTVAAEAGLELRVAHGGVLAPGVVANLMQQSREAEAKCVPPSSADGGWDLGAELLDGRWVPIGTGPFDECFAASLQPAFDASSVLAVVVYRPWAPSVFDGARSVP